MPKLWCSKKAHGSSANPDTKQMAYLHPSIGMATKWARNTVNPMARGARICEANDKPAQLRRSLSLFSASSFQASFVGIIVAEGNSL